MTDRKPIYLGRDAVSSDPSSLVEFKTTDVVGLLHGGTGVSSLTGLSSILNLSSFDVEDRGTSFPVAPSEGDRFFRTDKDLWFYWDSSRSKWLGDAVYAFAGAYLGGIANAYLYIDANQIRYSSTLGHAATEDLCFISGSVAVASTSTCVFQLRDDGSAVTSISLTASTSRALSNLNSASVVKSSVVSLYCSGTANGGIFGTFHARVTTT